MSDLSSLYDWFTKPRQPATEEEAHAKQKAVRNTLYDAVATEGSPMERLLQWASPDYKSQNTAGIYAKEPDLTGLAIALQPAYHGTPHRWAKPGEPEIGAKFDLSKMGSGEGAQAYGWGAYATKDPRIAEHYRETLAGSDLDSLADRWGNMPQPPPDSLAAKLARHYGDNGSRFNTERGTAIEDMARRIGARKERVGNMTAYRFPDDSALMVTDGGWDIANAKADPGRLYELDAPDDAELMHWDKPLRDQPPLVKMRLEREFLMNRIDGGMPPEQAQAFVNGTAQDMKGEKIAYFLGNGDARAASERLRAGGIPGHRYIGDTSGVENMVIYDPERTKVQGAYNDLREFLAAKGQK